MKQFYFLVLALVLFACKKESSPKVNSEKSPILDYIIPKNRPNNGVVNRVQSGPSVIFLDFDGQTVHSIYWNSNNPIYCASSGFGSTAIAAVVAYVTERYSSLDVTVTTDSTVYWAANQYSRQRVIFTPTCGWFGCGVVNGVANVGSFVFGDDTPCFVFASPTDAPITAAHEVGHTLSLLHNSVWDGGCHNIQEYNTGTVDGIHPSWGPIMGDPSGKDLETFTTQTDPLHCPNTLYEFYQINTYAVANKADDAPDLWDDGPALLTKNTFQPGVLSSPLDLDFWKINLNTMGSATVTVTTNGTVDVAVDVYDNLGNFKGTIDPAGSSDIPATVVGGILHGGYIPRFFGVRATYNNPNAPYGSLRGTYQIKVNW